MKYLGKQSKLWTVVRVNQKRKRERNWFLRGAVAAATLCCKGLFWNHDMALQHCGFYKYPVCVQVMKRTHYILIHTYLFPFCFII